MPRYAIGSIASALLALALSACHAPQASPPPVVAAVACWPDTAIIITSAHELPDEAVWDAGSLPISLTIYTGTLAAELIADEPILRTHYRCYRTDYGITWACSSYVLLTH